MHFGHTLTRVFVRGDKRDLHIRMKHQDPEQLAASVARAAKDSNAYRHASATSAFTAA
jgi:hypothetical protein